MSSSDKELLTLAAKAAGVGYADKDGKFIPFVPETWNPLTDDGDALRLAVKLGMGLDLPTQTSVYVVVNNGQLEYCKNKDHYAATRRAIVRAAAEIGRSMG